MKIYPWPFLSGEAKGDFGDYYINNHINDFAAKVDQGKFAVSFNPSTNSQYINNEIANGNLEWQAEVSCRSTFISTVFPLINNKFSIFIPKNDLLGEITLVLRIICLRDFEYKSDEFSKELSDITFKLKKGDIVGEKIVCWLLDHQFAKAPGLKSIFEITKPDTNAEDAHDCIMEPTRIRIVLPKRVFEEFHDKYNLANEARKLYSQTVIIAPLINVLSNLSSRDPETKVEERLIHMLKEKGLYEDGRKTDRIQNVIRAAYVLLGNEDSLVHILLKRTIT